MTARGSRWTIRSRITLLTAGLVLAAGLVIVVGGYWWLVTTIPQAAVEVDDGRIAVAVDQGTPIQVADDVVGPSILGTTEGAGADDAQPVTDLVSDAVTSASEQLAQEVARRAAVQSVALLVLVTAMALGIGWYAARRALAPVHAMTESAQRVGATSLSERIDLDGPDDEIRELGETFNDMLDRVETTVRGEQRLIANMSHELRTPLANQRAVLELALEGGAPDDDALHTAATTALEENIRATRLIEQLLVLARVEQSPVDSRDHEDVDLAELCGRLLSAPAAQRDRHGVHVVLDAPSSVQVRGDTVLLERMVGNLVENAVTHNVEDGRVDVRVGVRGGRPVVRVVNTGPVVAASELDRLRQPFRRGSAAGAPDRVGSHDGAGLGLSLVDAIARRYDVALAIEPGPEGGLTVELLWPRVPEEVGGATPTDTDRAGRSR